MLQAVTSRQIRDNVLAASHNMALSFDVTNAEHFYVSFLHSSICMNLFVCLKFSIR